MLAAVQGHFLWTRLLPCSSYSAFDIHICWNEPTDARIDPPVHTALIVILDLWQLEALGLILWMMSNEHTPAFCCAKAEQQPVPTRRLRSHRSRR